MKRILLVVALFAAPEAWAQTYTCEVPEAPTGGYVRIQVKADGVEVYSNRVPVPTNGSNGVKTICNLQIGAIQNLAAAPITTGLVDLTPPPPPPPPNPSPDPPTSGLFRAATGLINGAASAQTLATIENPTAAVRPLIVTGITISGSVGAIATTQFLYHVGRATAIPTGGTQLTAQKTNSDFPAVTAIVRQAPTATAAAGDLWTGLPGVLITAAGQDIVIPLSMTDEIVLAPGEALVVRADTNTTGWRHSVVFQWTNQ